MKVMVTAGGTIEPIDEVRRIINTSTGTTGIAIVQHLLKQNIEVTLVAPDYVQRKIDDSPLLTRFKITNVASLMHVLEAELTQTAYKAVIHAMAVSDYTTYGIATGEQLETAMSSEMHYGTFLDQFESVEQEKISSQHNDVFIRLVRTPKVIEYIKKWQPDTCLIGFKLLSNADAQQFAEVTLRQQQLAHSDYVVANDLTDINDKQHITKIYSDGRVLSTQKNVDELAKALLVYIQK